MAAGQEVFLTWGLLGAAIMQIASHNKHKNLLQRDSSLVAVVTFTILLLVAFLANTCVQILKYYGYNYTPGSFGKIFNFFCYISHLHLYFRTHIFLYIFKTNKRTATS